MNRLYPAEARLKEGANARNSDRIRWEYSLAAGGWRPVSALPAVSSDLASVSTGEVADEVVADRAARQVSCMNAPRGRRLTYVVLALGTIAVGLLVHLWGAALGRVARDVLGDALWAAMIAWWAGALAPGARLATRSALAYAICVLVEVSQLYHVPWLDAVRATRPGHLVLGSGFDPRDLVAYAAGVAGTALLERGVVARGAMKQFR
jgi:hypothetical protein